jgi:hypothetical protein
MPETLGKREKPEPKEGNGDNPSRHVPQWVTGTAVPTEREEKRGETESVIAKHCGQGADPPGPVNVAASKSIKPAVFPATDNLNTPYTVPLGAVATTGGIRSQAKAAGGLEIVGHDPMTASALFMKQMAIEMVPSVESDAPIKTALPVQVPPACAQKFCVKTALPVNLALRKPS